MLFDIAVKDKVKKEVASSDHNVGLKMLVVSEVESLSPYIIITRQIDC